MAKFVDSGGEYDVLLGRISESEYIEDWVGYEIVIFVGEWPRNGDCNDEEQHEIYKFTVLSDFVRFRRKYPEKMCMCYNYVLQKNTTGLIRPDVIASASHFKSFIKTLSAIGIQR